MIPSDPAPACDQPSRNLAPGTDGPARGSRTTARGTLYCIPTPIGDASSAQDCLPAGTLDRLRDLQVFVAENARSARRFLRQADATRDLQTTRITELNGHTPAAELPGLLAPLLAGEDMGLLSEAGCPGIADPGADLVALAQSHGLTVVPLTGPCSLVLALMASGLTGQKFAFVGYVPAEREARELALRALERRSAHDGESILMIETPYRAQALFDSLLTVLAPGTRLCLAREIGEPAGTTRTRTVAAWRQQRPALGRERVVFLLLAERQLQRTAGTSKPLRKVRPIA